MEAKQRLSEFDFSKKGCHISLVGPSLGGPANGVETLVLKSLAPTGENEMSKEMIEKSAVEVMITKAVEAATAKIQGELDAMKAEKSAGIEAARKAKLVAVLGEATAGETLLALKSLDEPAFELVLKGLTASRTAEGKSTMFVEKGVEGKTDPALLKQEERTNNGTMHYIKSVLGTGANK